MSRLDPDLWRLAQRVEVTQRRRLMLFADLLMLLGGAMTPARLAIACRVAASVLAWAGTTRP